MKIATTLDTNAILRYILNDLPEQSLIVREIVDHNQIVIAPEVVAEVMFVLNKSLNLTRNVSAGALIDFLEDTNNEDEIIVNALNTFINTKLDIVDCFMFARASVYKVFTFDKALKKLLDTL